MAGGTFHALAFATLRRHHEAAGFPNGFTCLDAADCEALTERVSQEVSEVLQIPMPRIYVRYSQAPYWGCGGKNL